MNAKKMPLKGFEDVCVFYKKLPTYNPVMTEGKPFTDKRNNVSKERVSKEIYGTMPLPMEQKNEGTRYPVVLLKYRQGTINLSTPPKSQQPYSST